MQFCVKLDGSFSSVYIGIVKRFGLVDMDIGRLL